MCSFRRIDAVGPSKSRRIAGDIAAEGFSVCEDFIDAELVDTLVEETRRLWVEGDFEHARVGQGSEKQRCPSVRGDWVRWIEEAAFTDGQSRYWRALEELRVAVNEQTMLGLFEWEGHLAVYPPGSFYRRHLDVFRHARERKMSTILYLNQGWMPVDGGELRLYVQGSCVDQYVDIAPRAGTLVTFLSEEFYHEVLPAHAERMSVTGWFRVRGVTPG